MKGGSPALRSREAAGLLGCRGKVADAAPDPHESRLAAPPAEPLDLLGDVLAQLLDCLRRSLLVGQEALGDADRPERQGLGVTQQPVLDPAQLDAPATHVDREPVGERGRVDHRQVAVVGLLGAAQDPDLQAASLCNRLEQVVSVAGIADRAGSRCDDVVDSRRVTERGEHLGRRDRALDCVGQQHTLLAHAGADADRLADLVGERPRPARLPVVYDQPERVRAEIDDGRPFHPARG